MMASVFDPNVVESVANWSIAFSFPHGAGGHWSACPPVHQLRSEHHDHTLTFGRVGAFALSSSYANRLDSLNPARNWCCVMAVAFMRPRKS